MNPVDWGVLAASLAFVVVYGVWAGGRSRDSAGYLLADRELRWGAVLLSMMATQASAITFLSTPGQAYQDGMRFVQFYFGLPLAMIVLAAVAVPLYRGLNVFTAYEYLERRFDAKTRTLAAFLFLVQRGLAAGLTIFAPSLILSMGLGWDLHLTCVAIGALVVVYTTTGGARAVSRTQNWQMAIMLVGFAAAFAAVVGSLPEGVGFLDALRVAGKAGKLETVSLSLDPNDRYTLWSGLLGGFFLQLSYFGTDQSQVQRLLTGRSVAASRLALLANGLVKVPMQFVVLLLGALVFAFYQFHAPPIFFNPQAVAKARASTDGDRLAELEAGYGELVARREEAARAILAAHRGGSQTAEAAATASFTAASEAATEVRLKAGAVIAKANPGGNPSDVNYVFLRFVADHLPVGLVGLVLAMVFAASMSSTSAELSALASTTVVDVVRRHFAPHLDERGAVVVGKVATVFWGGFAVTFAELASRLGSLVEAVNILGSLFYGTILGIFLVGFFLRRIGGTAVFLAALIAETGVLACFAFTRVSFLWYNAVGCLAVIAFACCLERLGQRNRARERAAP